MTKNTTIGSRFLVAAGLVAGTALTLGFPGLTYAATYAYVNQSGNVSTVTASEPMAAIRTAPGISLHSGVLLLSSQADNEIVGDSVSGT